MWVKILGGILLIAAAVTAGVLVFRGNSAPSQIASAPAHYYEDASRSIGRVRVKVFYAVPRNRTDAVYVGWSDLLSPVLEQAAMFHRLQFRGLSQLESDVYLEPIILEEDYLLYDTVDTNRGNPEGLRRIARELERRFPEFLADHDSEEFPVMSIIYEGVGAAGADSAMILSRSFLSDPQYSEFASSLFYHELGHTMGLPDLYDVETNQPFSDDIMGAGRRRPLGSNYLDFDLLAAMGVGK